MKKAKKKDPDSESAFYRHPTICTLFLISPPPSGHRSSEQSIVPNLLLVELNGSEVSTFSQRVGHLKSPHFPHHNGRNLLQSPHNVLVSHISPGSPPPPSGKPMTSALNPFSWVFNAISSEKSSLILKPFLTCLLYVRTLNFFPAC